MEEAQTLLIMDSDPDAVARYSIIGRDFRLLFARTTDEALKIVEEEKKQSLGIMGGFFDLLTYGTEKAPEAILKISRADSRIQMAIVGSGDFQAESITEVLESEYRDQWDYFVKPLTRDEISQKARQMTAAWRKRQKYDFETLQLIKTEQLASIGQIARGVGHEFGNILQRIHGKVELAMMETDLPKIMKHLIVVLKAVDRASGISKNLQAISKVEPNFQMKSVTAAIEEAVALMSHDLSRSSIELVRNYGDIPLVRLDEASIAQVVLNLLINAVHAMPNGGKITIATELGVSDSGRQGVLVRVSDTGPGIPEEVLPRIFDYAFTTKGERGSGIGLSVSRDIIKAHCGSIGVKTQLGLGTEFVIWIPLHGLESAIEENAS